MPNQQLTDDCAIPKDIQIALSMGFEYSLCFESGAREKFDGIIKMFIMLYA